MIATIDARKSAEETTWRRKFPRSRPHEHLTTATTMHREMDMRFWLEQTETELGAWA